MYQILTIDSKYGDNILPLLWLCFHFYSYLVYHFVSSGYCKILLKREKTQIWKKNSFGWRLFFQISWMHGEEQIKDLLHVLLASFSIREWNLEWYFSFRKYISLMIAWSLKALIISDRLAVVELILGFRSKVVAVLIKCLWKISDGPLLSDTMKFSSKTILLFKKSCLC